jgi:stage II sporulation protein D
MIGSICSIERLLARFLGVCVLSFTCSKAIASQTDVLVSLFAAQRPLTLLEVDGPFIVLEKGSNSCVKRKVVFEKGRYQFLSSAGYVQLHLIDKPSSNQGLSAKHSSLTTLRAREFLLLAPANRLLTVIRSGDTRHYHGMISIKAMSSAVDNAGISKKGFLDVINRVSRRDYLASVLASEMPRGAPLETLKAQAILANTAICQCVGKAILDDSTQLQSYQGTSAARPETYAAVDQAKDQILKFRGVPAKVFFHSTCAGMTSRPVDIFGGELNAPYLRNIACTKCRLSPFWLENISTVPKNKFATVFGASLPQIVDTDRAGRPTKVGFYLNDRKVEIDGYHFWLLLGQKFGWDKAPGNRYRLSEKNGQVLIISRGAGHGVGLCQWGAIALGLEGKNCDQILDYYFPGAEVR